MQISFKIQINIWNVSLYVTNVNEHDEFHMGDYKFQVAKLNNHRYNRSFFNSAILNWTVWLLRHLYLNPQSPHLIRFMSIFITSILHAADTLTLIWKNSPFFKLMRRRQCLVKALRRLKSGNSKSEIIVATASPGLTSGRSIYGLMHLDFLFISSHIKCVVISNVGFFGFLSA